MKFAEIDIFDELFTHVADTPGREQTTYNVTRLFDHILAHIAIGSPSVEIPLVPVPVEEEHATYCMENRGVEEDRIVALVDNPDYLKKPILFVMMPDESALLVDGTHRYVLAHMVGATRIPAYIVPFTVARPFIIEDMPSTDEASLMEYSGIAKLRQLQRRVPE